MFSGHKTEKSVADTRKKKVKIQFHLYPVRLKFSVELLIPSSCLFQLKSMIIVFSINFINK